MVYTLARLRGRVMGYKTDKYTRPLHNVNVFLRIHIIDNAGREHVYNPLDRQHMTELRDHFPDVFHAVLDHKDAFSAKQVKDTQGNFEFTNVPVGWWCYLIAADCEGNVTDLRHPMANNGFDQHAEIKGPDLQANPDLDGIIVPAEDRWYTHTTPRPDRRMDPRTEFVQGMRRKNS